MNRAPTANSAVPCGEVRHQTGWRERRRPTPAKAGPTYAGRRRSSDSAGERRIRRIDDDASRAARQSVGRSFVGPVAGEQAEALRADRVRIEGLVTDGVEGTRSGKGSAVARQPDRSGRLVALMDETYEAVMAAPLAAVVVTDGANANSVRYLAEVRTMLAAGELAGVTVVVLDRVEASGDRFWQEHPWVAGLRLMPYTLVLAHGEKVDEFAAIRADILDRRLRKLRPRDPVSVVDSLDDDRWDAWIQERRTAA
jgi:hypothetical protein